MDDTTQSDDSSWTFTVNVSDQGRLYIPHAVRRAMGINGESAVVEVEATAIDTDAGAGDV